MDLDRRRERRELTLIELSMLYGAARQGPTKYNMTGRDREALYRLASGTGFRAKELASLLPSAFELDATPPTITLAAKFSKNKKPVHQPIRSDLATWLRPWLEARPTDEPVFTGKRLYERTAKMIRFDLAAAKIPYQDADGRYSDFHSLRAGYVSRLIRSGASPKEAQVLARHADPSITLAVYTKIRQDDLSRALERAEEPTEKKSGPVRPAAEKRATGTEGGHAKRHGSPVQPWQLVSTRDHETGDTTKEPIPPAMGETGSDRRFTPVVSGRPAGTRTQNARIMSPLL